MASPLTPSASWSYYGPSENCTGGSTLCAGLLKKSEAVGTVVGGNGFTSRTEFLYDAKGRMTENKQTTSGTWNSDLVIGTVKYDYNGADQVEDVTYPSLRKVRTCGNQMGQTVSVSGLALNGFAARTYATGGLYEGDGGLKEMTIGGLKETRTYNAKRQVEGIALATTGGNARWSLTNHYCDFAVDCATNNGNIMKQEISQPKPQAEGGTTISFTVNYQYDALNRLTSAQEPAANGSSLPWGQTFDYDRYGNRWMTGAAGGVPSGVPNGPDWFEPTKNQIKGVGITHDAAGHLTAMGTGSHLLAWDTEGRKVEDKITSSGTDFKTWYAYDAEGRRVRRQTADGAWKVFIYDGRGRLAAEMESVDGPVTETRMMYGDHLGSTRVVAGLDGVVVKRYDYMPFGEEVQADVSGRSELEYGGGVAQRFTGKERDEGLMEARMDYFGARYLGAGVGRFVSPDLKSFSTNTIARPQKWNRYSYVLNNPLVLYDPDGMEERRSGSHTINLVTAASKLINVRVGAGPGLKGKLTLPVANLEGGVTVLANVKVPVPNVLAPSVYGSAEAGARASIGSVGFKGQLKYEGYVVKEGKLDPHVEDKTGLGAETPASRTKGNSGTADVTLIGVAAPIGAVGVVPISGEADLNLNTDHLRTVLDEFPKAVQEVKDGARSVLKSLVPDLDWLDPRSWDQASRRQ